MQLRTVSATRYVTPLREGGSLPAIVEGDDEGLYVLKFRSAGQGIKALIAEVIAGELARAAGFRIPEIVLVQLDAALGRNEPDYEIRELVTKSAGLNLALDYLPGSITFDPVANRAIDPDLASAIVWFDAFITNVDRTARNTNMLMWHKNLWLIDHGAALFFHHVWTDPLEKSLSPFTAIKDHVLLPFATALSAAEERMLAILSADVIEATLNAIPDEWLEAVPSPFDSAVAHRAAYQEYLRSRLAASSIFTREAEDARQKLV